MDRKTRLVIAGRAKDVFEELRMRALMEKSRTGGQVVITRTSVNELYLEAIEDAMYNPDDTDVWKLKEYLKHIFEPEIREKIRREEEYKELGRIQAHQEYELTKGGY